MIGGEAVNEDPALLDQENLDPNSVSHSSVGHQSTGQTAVKQYNSGDFQQYSNNISMLKYII